MTLVHSCRKHKFVKGFSALALSSLRSRVLNGVEEGKARMGEGGRDKEVDFCKTKTELKTRMQNSIPYL